jgi:heme A synthase
MPVNQVILGVYVILTGKSFWVTNLHVLNGLGILVLSFLVMISVWASTTGIGLLGQSVPDKAKALI